MPGDHTAREARPRPQIPASPSVGSPVPGLVSDACTACHLAPRRGRHLPLVSLLLLVYTSGAGPRGPWTRPGCVRSAPGAPARAKQPAAG